MNSSQIKSSRALGSSLVRLTDQSLEAVGHGVTQVRLSAQIRAVSVEHEAIQFQFLQQTEHTHVKHASLMASARFSILCLFKGIQPENVWIAFIYLFSLIEKKRGQESSGEMKSVFCPRRESSNFTALTDVRVWRPAVA